MLLADLSNPAQRTTRYHHTDDLYNVMAVTDGAGNVVERYEYDDYGTPMVMAPDGTVFASSTIGNPYLFTGRRYDAETSWYHYRTRYLDPAAGRFTTRDIIGIWGDPWEFGNGYTYVANGPLSYLDPAGLGWWAKWGKTVAGGLSAALLAPVAIELAGQAYANHVEKELSEDVRKLGVEKHVRADANMKCGEEGKNLIQDQPYKVSEENKDKTTDSILYMLKKDGRVSVIVVWTEDGKRNVEQYYLDGTWQEMGVDAKRSGNY
jgi:RHS repeat-associated protein